MAALCAAAFPESTIANISAPCARDAAALERHAQRCGCVATMLAPPYYFAAAPEAGLEAFFSEVLRATALPCFLYNFPRHTGNARPPSPLRPLL